MKRTIRIVCFALCCLMIMTGVAFAQFSDIEGHWAQPQITEWVDQGLIKGYSDGTFRPDVEITRAEFAAMVNRAFEFTEAGTVSFPDVGANKWYAQVVAIASNAGYIAGYGDGTFKPDNNITRQEAAVMISRILDLDTTDLSKADGFIDANMMQQWGKGSIGAVNEAAIMQGYQDKSFRPNNPITRAESIVTIDRSMKYEPGEVPEEPEVASAIEGQVIFNGKGVKADLWIFAKDSIEVLKKLETNKDGEFKVELDAGSYDITASTDAEVGYASGVSVSNNKVTQQNIQLEKAAIVEGKLVDKNDKIVKNVDILFTTNPTFIGRTNNSGEYRVPVLPNRTYHVRAYKSDNADKPDSIEKALKVGAAGTTKLDDALVGPWGGFGGGGGGVTSRPAVVATGLTVFLGDEEVDAELNDNGTYATVDLSSSDYNGLAITKVYIDVPAGSSLTPSEVDSKELNVELYPNYEDYEGYEEYLPTYVITGLPGDVPISELLGLGNDEVYLSTLRTVFGDWVEVTGTLACEGFRSSTVTLRLILQ